MQFYHPLPQDERPSLLFGALSLFGDFCWAIPKLDFPSHYRRHATHQRRQFWGYAQRGAPILSILLDGVARIANFQCKQLLSGNYHRLSPPLVDDFKSDDSGKMDAMLAFADQVDLTADAAWLRTV